MIKPVLAPAIVSIFSACITVLSLIANIYYQLRRRKAGRRLFTVVRGIRTTGCSVGILSLFYRLFFHAMLVMEIKNQLVGSAKMKKLLRVG